ncbi:cral trio domain containing protein [Grosmannia clavigera kw1407]|uniref:Cral trio domain containing protein n=1 Tax=Grosmannia clavigera (strain kw1407 / UAMH 11150) TaxID=655863 RepID=F0XC98_GROCL|nr:cral trio domain containing protein [Grosmannia clavigera kw1407]EFX03972.1 cral trio domain containing protein [Grosmannia clavigera kw1407]
MGTAQTAAAGSSALQEKQADGPRKTPFELPEAGCKPAARPTLTDAQKTKYDWLLEQAKSWTEVASEKDKGGPITEAEQLWLSRECLLRFLRATKWNEKEAAKRLQETLSWRRDYGVESLTADYISPENETGKQLILGFDKETRVCQYLNPGRQNTEVSPRQVEHLVYMLERVIDLLPPGQETLSLLINFKQGKSRTNTAPGIGQGREVLHILQTYYPERLGRALIVNVPWVVWGFFKLITPFIDPLTREKLKFNEDMNQYVPSDQLWSDFGGKLQFEYDHAAYWPALTKLTEERREARKARWIAGGSRVGEFEDYLNGASETGVASTEK